MNRLLRLALIAAASISITAHAVLARENCDISTAVPNLKPPALPVPDQKHFRIFWHVATQIEDIADADTNPDAMAEIRSVQKLVDGYYMNLLITGPLVYWPDRPTECRANFKRIQEGDSIEIQGENFDFPGGGSAGRNSCEDRQAEFERNKGFSDTVALQYDAMGRVLKNLNLKKEQASGKEVIGVLILDTEDMDYNSATDRIVLKELPKTMCFFNSEHFAANSWMTYQEPNIQLKRGNFVWVPRLGADGKPRRSDDAKQDRAPDNPRVYDLVENAFRKQGVDMGKIYANMRRWNRRNTPELARQLAALPEIRGFNFEGGAAITAIKQRKLKTYSAGIAWVLQNTDKNVSILMPGYWDRSDIGSDAEIDTLPERTADYVRTLNTLVSRNMGLPRGQNALCTGRLILIPGSYGQPIHVKTLPSMSNGKYAGTVTGEIRMLADLRREMCGK